MYERPRVNVKVERGSTFKFTRDLPPLGSQRIFCMFYLLTAVSVWEFEEMFQELHTCLLVSKLTCSRLIYVTDPLFQGGF